MKAVFGLAVLCVATVFLGLGCEQSGIVSGVPELEEEAAVSVGDTHNEFLERVHERGRQGESAIEAALEAANEMAAEHDLEPFTREQVLEAYTWGQEKVGGDLLKLVEAFLSPREFSWFLEFAGFAFSTEGSIAEVENRFQDFVSHRPMPRDTADSTNPQFVVAGLERNLRRSGHATRARRGNLECMMEIMMASGKYWAAYERGPSRQAERAALWSGLPDEIGATWSGGEPLHGIQPHDSGWLKRVARFLTYVAVDAVSGTLANGAGGPVAGAIIGGLASYGADELLFGEEEEEGGGDQGEEGNDDD